MSNPTPKALQAILRKLTETLAYEPARPRSEAPGWSEFEWTTARAVAAMHGVSPLLAHLLRWGGPVGWRIFLAQQRTHTALRHARIAELLQRIDRRACEEGIPGVALKGAALHAIGVYSPGERPMADIDLLVRPGDAARATSMLESLGYRASFTCWKETVFVPVDARVPGDLGEHSNNGIKIELHERVCEKLPLRITDATEHIFPTDARPGLNPYPSRASLMIHLLLHSAGAMAFQSLRLLHLNDIAQMSLRMQDAEWDTVLALKVGGEPLWWAFPPLRLTSVYYPAAVPGRVLKDFMGMCPPLLVHMSRHKTLCDVSYSHLWVDAFPGIEWCRSVPEAVRYAVSRVRPSGEHLAQREMAATTQAWASDNRWAAMSQGRRIVSWLVSRQQRPVTLHAVDAASARAR